MLEYVLEFVGLLGTYDTEQDVVVASDALLGLQLGGYELMIYVFHISNAGEGHLLLYIMAEPVSTYGVAKDEGNYGAKKHTSVEHRLEGEAASHGE